MNRDIDKGCPARHIIDEPDLWFHGAHVIYFNGNNIRNESARSNRGERPWSVGWGKKKADDEED